MGLKRAAVEEHSRRSNTAFPKEGESRAGRFREAATMEQQLLYFDFAAVFCAL